MYAHSNCRVSRPHISINSQKAAWRKPILGRRKGTYKKSLEHPLHGKQGHQGLPGGPVVKTPPSRAGDTLSPGWGHADPATPHSSQAYAPQLLSPCALEAALHNRPA